jgi:hypothetical protein
MLKNSRLIRVFESEFAAQGIDLGIRHWIVEPRKGYTDHGRSVPGSCPGITTRSWFVTVIGVLTGDEEVWFRPVAGAAPWSPVQG